MGIESKTTGGDGLPAKSSDEGVRDRARAWRNFLGIFVGPLIVGGPIACAIVFLGDTTAYTDNVQNRFPEGAMWVFLAAFVFARLNAFLTTFPIFEKEAVMRSDSGNLRANMQLYALLEDETRTVVLKTQGAAGRYNRANRSLGNYIENAAPIAVNLVLLSLCFPLPMFVLICVFASARVLHQVRYINIGYGYVGHGIGFFSGLAVTGVMESLLLLSAWLAVG